MKPFTFTPNQILAIIALMERGHQQVKGIPNLFLYKGFYYVVLPNGSIEEVWYEAGRSGKGNEDSD